MNEAPAKDILKAFSARKIIWPILLGLGVASFLLIRGFDREAFAVISWSWYSSMWILISFFMVVVRDLAYMYRIRVLTGNELNWRQCFDVIMLWEFASAIVPPVIGGGFAFAILIINKEKISMGRSISVVMFTSFLDGLFFAIVAPIVYLIGSEKLFFMVDPETVKRISYGVQVEFWFWLVYTVVLVYKLFVAYALFINARAVKFFLLKLFSLRIVRKWRRRLLLLVLKWKL